MAAGVIFTGDRIGGLYERTGLVSLRREDMVWCETNGLNSPFSLKPISMRLSKVDANVHPCPDHLCLDSGNGIDNGSCPRLDD